MLTRELLFLEKYQLYKHIPFCFSDILANRDEGNQSNSQTQRDPIYKAIGEYFIKASNCENRKLCNLGKLIPQT